jgi:integrase
MRSRRRIFAVHEWTGFAVHRWTAAAEPRKINEPNSREQRGRALKFVYWEKIFKDSLLSDVTLHVLRHSFASVGNDLGFTEVTIAALVGHAKGSVTSKYIHTLDTALIMAADTIAGYIEGLLDGKEFKQTTYALDRDSRKAALARFLRKATGNTKPEVSDEQRLVA